jgi:hypothetical protein
MSKMNKVIEAFNNGEYEKAYDLGECELYEKLCDD